jgi:DNA adenine methylase
MSQEVPLFNNSVTPLSATRDVPRSALRYFGGKWSIAPWVIGHMPPHRVYVEPFGGAASVLLRKPRSRVEVYNDLDDEIVGIFRVLQNPDQCCRLFRLLRRTPYSRREFDLAHQPASNPVVRAQRAIIRSYMSFHHVALHQSGMINTFASAKHRSGGSSKANEWRNYPRALVHIYRRLRGVVIENRDAFRVVTDQDAPDTLFYVDPPYVMSTRHRETCYRHEFDDAQHASLLERLKQVRGRVLISDYACEMYDDTLVGWTRVTRKSFAASDGRGERTEVLWISPPN